MPSKVVVVTGASSGIGASLSEVLGKQGHRVVLVARRAAELDAVRPRCGAEAITAVADVTRRGDVEQALATAIAKFGHVDVWVNNAGRAISRNVSELTDDDVDTMVQVNLKSVLYGMQAVLPHFKARGAGHIVNVSSMLGRIPFATIRSMYSATKAAMNALSASLRMELRDAFPGIAVSVVHPGVVATDFGLNALHGGPDNRHLPGAQPVEEVAAVIADVIENPRADVYTRPGAREMVAGYYGAPDMAEAEKNFGRR
ncbi:MAG TPA: SDR family oxidoreductase [Polyangiaceae bacterium]|nr:SDR family oxidoreductase [Polyangiaceae bacterium]